MEALSPKALWVELGLAPAVTNDELATLDGVTP
jgi:hypothetical protein